MPATLDTPRFGRLEIPDEHLLELPAGLIGIPGTRYALLRLDDGPFVWLQSLENPALALPLCDPFACFADAEVVLSATDLERTGAGDADAVRVWSTVRATPEGAHTVNLRAPLVVVGRRAWQVLNEAVHAPLRAPLAAAPDVAPAPADGPTRTLVAAGSS